MEPIETRIARAVADWKIGLDRGRFVQASEAQETYGSCTTGTGRRIAGALQLVSLAEVQAAVTVANRHRVQLYPISTGNNWGYGTANPVADGCVIADLSRMKRIEIDRDLNLATLEPGVTQGDLRAYLDRHAPGLMVPTTGAGPNCSLLGNALERGYGITPYADHFGAVTSLEAVLPSGALYRSALAELGGVTLDRAFKWGMGPYLDGLFAQGNFGIVTRMTIALARRPRRVEAFFFQVREDGGLEDAVGAVQSLLNSLGGVIGSINLMNARRLVSMMVPYPSDRCNAAGVLPESAVLELARSHRGGAWTGVGALYGEPGVVKAGRAIVRRALKGIVTHLVFLTPERAQYLHRAVRSVPLLRSSRFGKQAMALNESLRLISGVPSEISLPLAYWKSGRQSVSGSLNPARDGCGLIWYPPLVPMKRETVREYVTYVNKVCTDHGIEPLITLTTLSERCFDSSVPLLFDRQNAVEVQRARDCYNALFEAGRERGFVPYRLGIDGMERIGGTEAAVWDVMRAIKGAIDPNHILAPGRYAPLPEPTEHVPRV